MKIVFDPAKHKKNLTKHGIGLDQARNFDWQTTKIRPDLRYDYGEKRWIAYDFINGRLYVLAFTKREEGIRAISL